MSNECESAHWHILQVHSPNDIFREISLPPLSGGLGWVVGWWMVVAGRWWLDQPSLGGRCGVSRGLRTSRHSHPASPRERSQPPPSHPSRQPTRKTWTQHLGKIFNHTWKNICNLTSPREKSNIIEVGLLQQNCTRREVEEGRREESSRDRAWL